MRLEEITNAVTSIKGIGSSIAKTLSKLGIFTVSDLIMHFPRDYDDRSKLVGFRSWQEGKVNTIAIINKVDNVATKRGIIPKFFVEDTSGKAMLFAIGREWLSREFFPNAIVYVNGVFKDNGYGIQSSSFELQLLKQEGTFLDISNIALPQQSILPIYALTQGLLQKNLRKYVKDALATYGKVEDTLPQDIIAKYKLMSKQTALKQLHFPNNIASLTLAQKTLAFEELYDLELAVLKRAFSKKGSNSLQDTSANLEDFANDLCPYQKQFLATLHFDLTRDQKRAIAIMNAQIDRGYKERACYKDSISSQKPYTMSVLLQADVGAGKTLVAFFSCLRIIQWGGQCALMCPTELLAMQHANNADKLLSPLGVKVAFLTGNVKTKTRSVLLNAIKEGAVDFVVGTHALFSDDVHYSDLQLAIIDEQHRFGVLQREAILHKGKNSDFCPHLIMMSATPIPQSLALTVFGDLDIIEIRTMPQGRLPIKTLLTVFGHESNVYAVIKEQLKQGYQAYFVYPRIETDAEKDIKSATESFDYLSKQVFPNTECALLHSQVPDDMQAKILDDFTSGKVKILVATSVVEVGVDVPRATCMVIEHAERFGLAQLHQMRGRVGRSNVQSYCFLIYSPNITQIGKQRLKVMRESTDGFFIAQEDLKLRGPGEILGVMQSGDMKLLVADIKKDQALLSLARKEALAHLKAKNT